MQTLYRLNQVLSEVFNDQENDSYISNTQSLDPTKHIFNIINKAEEVIIEKHGTSNKSTYDGNFSLLIQDLKKIDIIKDTEEIVLSDDSVGINKLLFELTDLNEYLSSLTYEIEDLEGGSITINLDTTISTCCIDTKKTSIILNNILSNAFKYSFGEANVCLSVSLVEFGGNQWLNYKVTDKGIGLSPEQIKNIFLPFYRGNPSGYVPGNGLGMTVAKEHIDDMEGHVDIQSIIKEGTTVNVKFKYYPTIKSTIG
jgi:signal transduction histidine kinase